MSEEGRLRARFHDGPHADTTMNIRPGPDGRPPHQVVVHDRTPEAGTEHAHGPQTTYVLCDEHPEPVGEHTYCFRTA